MYKLYIFWLTNSIGVILLDLNSKAPDFSLDGSDGKRHTLREFSGKYLVLYFYPKDDTPGCTIEARGFNTRLNDIDKLGAVVVGVSSDSLDSHCKFQSKYNLGFLLLSDPSHEVIKDYGAYGDRGIFGMGTMRTTVLIDRTGHVVKVFKKVNPSGHEDEIIKFIKSHSE